MPRALRIDILKAFEKDIEILRDAYGTIAPNWWFRQLFTEARTQSSYTFISKMHIDTKMFRRYERVFPRWPHIKLHAFVIFDGKDNSTTNRIYELEDALYDDSKLLLEQARGHHKGVEDFRRRSATDQKNMQSYLRLATLSLFTLLEAYLNGLAYDCVQTFQDRLSIVDHDLLSEWDSQKKRRRFVAFDLKVFKYPVIVANAQGKNLDLSGCIAAHRIANDGKTLRDALTHPSPYINPKSRAPDKISSLILVNLPFVEGLFGVAREYILAVETGVGNDPKKSVPWLFG